MQNPSFTRSVQLLLVCFLTFSLVFSVQADKKRQKGPQKHLAQSAPQKPPISTSTQPTPPVTQPTLKPQQAKKGSQISKCDPSFAQDLLAMHNRIRIRHSAPPLLLNSNITKLAQLWSEELAQTGFLKHRPNRKLGENLYTARLLCPRQLYPSEPMALWYGEHIKYHWYNGEEPDLDSFTLWGHYTQIVWRSSRLVGIGCAEESKGNYSNTKTVYVTVSFYPKGNVVGHFADNVLPAQGDIWPGYGTVYPAKSTPKSTTTAKATKKLTTTTTTKPTTKKSYTKSTKPTTAKKPTTKSTKTTTKKLTTAYSSPKTTTKASTPGDTSAFTESETSTSTAATSTRKPPNSTPSLSTCNHNQYNGHGHHHQGYPYQVVRPLQPPPPPPPAPETFPIDFTDPDDFEDFLKYNSKSGLKKSAESAKD